MKKDKGYRNDELLNEKCKKRKKNNIIDTY